MNTLCLWFDRWKVRLNAEKTQAVVFTKRRQIPPEPIRVNDVPVEYLSQAKYLGVLLDKGLTFTPHVQSVRQKALQLRNALFPLLTKRSRLSTGSKLLLYKTLIRPVMTYACSAWQHTSKTNLHSLQVVQNRTLRVIVGAEWYVSNATIHRDLQVQFLNAFVREYARKVFAKAEVHQNPLLQSAVDYEPDSALPHKRPRLTLDDS